MKTTVEVSDALLAEAKAVARQERTTVRALIEEGLRAALARRKQASRFKLRKASVKGRGLQAGFSAARWTEIRDAAYEGRGT